MQKKIQELEGQSAENFALKQPLNCLLYTTDDADDS